MIWYILILFIGWLLGKFTNAALLVLAQKKRADTIKRWEYDIKFLKKAYKNQLEYKDQIYKREIRKLQVQYLKAIEVRNEMS